MDAYSFYLSTFRYVMNANPDDKATWCDIFKYIPCLRQMLSCSVCGSILLCPYGPTHGVCLHHVCQRCLGGQMRLKPSCSWCKDHDPFVENKRLRILILCFKRLCAYVSHSKLGAEIMKSSINGYGSEAEKTMKVLEEAEQFEDDYILTPPPRDLPLVTKSATKGLKSSTYPAPSTSNVGTIRSMQPCKRKRGRPKGVSKLSVKAPKTKMNITEHVKRLKKRALSSKVKNSVKKPLLKVTHRPRAYKRRQRAMPDNSGLLISQRPHRDRSGKSSIGQLWRETFLDEVQPESYPDSGIEVGNSSDHDTGIQPPQLTRLVNERAEPQQPPQLTRLTNERQDPTVSKSEVIRKETRLHKHTDGQSNEMSGNSVTGVRDESQKPRLTLTISRKRFQNFSRRGRGPVTAPFHKLRDSSVMQGRTQGSGVTQATQRFKKKSGKAASTRSAKPGADICKCARFKQPNQLTCFGQKCPCYSDRRACVDCLCNGCKNPLRSHDSAPPLMHIIKDTDSLERSFDRSMPRLSPIPRI